MSHLDVKPANIMLDSNDNALLIDFGLAKQYDGQSGEQTSSTPVGISEGYAAPEQYRMGGVGRFSPATDVYALAATFYFLLTGERPPVAADVVEDGVPLANLQLAKVSQKAIYTIEKAMKGRRKDRLKSVKDLLEALDGKGDTSLGDTDILNETQPLSRIDSRLNSNQVITPPQWHSGKSQVEVLGKRPKSRKERLLEAFGFKNTSSLEETTISVSTFSNGGLTFNVCGVSFDMIPVEGGTFTMGAAPDQGDDAFDFEKPAHDVTLDSYYIGKTEVTQSLWEAVMGNNPSSFKGSNRPVENVSWDDCQTFISKLNQFTGKRFRLPTEAEWEYAARGGRQSLGYKYAGSNNLDEVAWYDGNSGNQTHDVGTKRPNELGLYDMSGNVWEWCSDWYGDYSSAPQTNPTGASGGARRVLRGGSWFNFARYCRVSNRINYFPDFRYYYYGLRLSLFS